MSNSASDHCAKPIKGEEDSITCMAFCERMVHLNCTGNKTTKLNKSFVKIVHENPNLLWMCDECVQLMKMARLKTSVSSFGEANKAITEKQESVHAEIKKHLAEQGQQIAQLSKRMTPLTPMVQGPTVISSQPTPKRRRDEELAINKPLLGGTRIVADTDVITVPEPVELSWLYLSRIHPSVQPEAVERLMKDCLEGIDTIKAGPLIKRGADDMTSMSFISYKIGIKPKFREMALIAETWPKGLMFREFEDHTSKNLWLPQTDFSRNRRVCNCDTCFRNGSPLTPKRMSYSNQSRNTLCSSLPERTACRPMGDPELLDPVAPTVFHPYHRPVSCHQSSSGPAVEFGVGVSKKPLAS